MSYRTSLFCFEDKPSSSLLPFCSPISIVGLLVGILGFWPVGVSLAQLPSDEDHSNSRNWALEVANAQKNLDPNRLPDIAKTRDRLDQAIKVLENFLATSPQHEANWLAFLTWNDLKKELKYYLTDHFDLAKKSLDQNAKTTLSSQSVSKDSITKLFQTGAHDYHNSKNEEQALALSIILGAILNLTHGKES